MAKFTQAQIEQAKTEFATKNLSTCQVLPGAGHNGDILIIRGIGETTGEENGNGQAASE